jgi:acetylornithine deacetylase/succinyl-diaminopimelate desuccinylase-like protein
MRNHSKIIIGMIAGLSLSSVAVSDPDTLTEHQRLARDIFKTVIEMDTSTTRHETPKMAAYLAGLFKNAGFPDEDVQQVTISPTHTSLIVRYRGADQDAKGIGFLGHMDVVTAFKKDWVLDPFTLTEQDGYFIGRGTSDNKAGVVGLTASFLKLKKSGFQPQRNIILILTADEETSMASAHHIAQNMADEINIEYGINSDGLSGILAPDGSIYGYFVQGAEKSYRSVELTVRNTGGHSSAPRADNAIYELAAALKKIESFQFPVIINEINAGMLTFAKGTTDQKTSAAIDRLLDDPRDAEAASIVSLDDNLRSTIRTTCVATMLSAGHAENALPQSATATVNCRIMPSTDPKEIYRTLSEVVGNEDVEVKPLREAAIAPASPMRQDILDAISYAITPDYPDVELVPFMASYGTDGLEFRAAGIPVYGSAGFFAKPSDINAHGLNEKIPVQTFYKTLGYWERLMTRLAGTAKN